MSYRWILFFILFAWITFSAAPRSPIFSNEESAYHLLNLKSDQTNLNSDQLESLLKTDPIAALRAGLTKYRADVHSFTAILHKSERIGNTLHPEEIINVSVREEPFAVMMLWNQGARNQAEGTLYVAGENNGNMKVWRPKALLAKTLNVGPNDAIARSASRYSLAESSLYHGHFRTYQRWSQAKDVGQLTLEYKGKRAIPELGGRICHELIRTCDPPESDSYTLSEPPRTDANQLFKTVHVFLDTEIGIQLGAILTRADGQKVGSYLFRDVVFNAAFPAGQFTLQAFQK